MKKHSSHILFVLTTILMLSAVLRAQDGRQPSDPKPPPTAQQDQDKPNLLGELGLSVDQIRAIRRMNADRKPIVEAANRRLREANRSLDEAIYGDVPADAGEFQARLKEYQSAQADVARIRFESELNVRSILTPDQLVRFREVRRRFAEARKNMRQGIKPLRPRQQLRPANRPPIDRPLP